MLPRRPKTTPRHPETLPRRLQDAPRCPKTLPRRAQDAPRCPETLRRRPKTRPRCAQDAPKTTQDTPKLAQNAPRRFQDAPKTPQDVPKTPQYRSSKLLQRQNYKKNGASRSLSSQVSLEGQNASKTPPRRIFFPSFFRCLFGSIFDRSWLGFPPQLGSQNLPKSMKNRCQEALQLGLRILIDF